MKKIQSKSVNQIYTCLWNQLEVNQIVSEMDIFFKIIWKIDILKDIAHLLNIF